MSIENMGEKRCNYSRSKTATAIATAALTAFLNIGFAGCSSQEKGPSTDGRTISEVSNGEEDFISGQACKDRTDKISTTNGTRYDYNSSLYPETITEMVDAEIGYGLDNDTERPVTISPEKRQQLIASEEATYGAIPGSFNGNMSIKIVVYGESDGDKTTIGSNENLCTYWDETGYTPDGDPIK